MGDLSAKKRSKLPSKDFGLPKERKYPVENKSHARDAKSRASEEEHKGHITKAQERKIDRKANKVLGEKGSSRKG